MAQIKSGAERARKYRARKAAGVVVIQDLELSPAGVEWLIRCGKLDAKAAGNSANVRRALIQAINATASEQRGQPFRQALKSISFGLF